MDSQRVERRLTENVRMLEEELDTFAHQAYPGPLPVHMKNYSRF
jgi:hypothetical protein